MTRTTGSSVASGGAVGALRAVATSSRAQVNVGSSVRTPIMVHVQDTAGVGLHDGPWIGVVRFLEPSAHKTSELSRSLQAAQTVSKSSTTRCRCARHRGDCVPL